MSVLRNIGNVGNVKAVNDCYFYIHKVYTCIHTLLPGDYIIMHLLCHEEVIICVLKLKKIFEIHVSLFIMM